MEKTLEVSLIPVFSPKVSLTNSIQLNMNTSSNGKLITPWANISIGQLCQLENLFSYWIKSALPVFRVKRNFQAHQLECIYPTDQESCDVIILQMRNLKLKRIKQLFHPQVTVQHQEQKCPLFPTFNSYENIWKHNCVRTSSMYSSHSWSNIILISFLSIVLLDYVSFKSCCPPPACVQMSHDQQRSLKLDLWLDQWISDPVMNWIQFVKSLILTGLTLNSWTIEQSQNYFPTWSAPPLCSWSMTRATLCLSIHLSICPFQMDQLHFCDSSA